MRTNPTSCRRDSASGAPATGKVGLWTKADAAIHVTHDPREAGVLTDRIAVIEAGRLVQIGTMNELREHPASPFVDKLLSP